MKRIAILERQVNELLRHKLTKFKIVRRSWPRLVPTVAEGVLCALIIVGSGVNPALGSPIVTFGSGTAVSMANRIATFESLISFGSADLVNYTENAMCNF